MGDTKKEYVVRTEEAGSIQISEDVVAAIAVSAALEVDGVGELAAGSSNPLSKKNAVRGVKLAFDGDTVAINLQIMAQYGHPIPALAQSGQESVASAVESMTELTVSQVNVRISGVTFGGETAQS